MHVTLLTPSPRPERVARALAPRGGLAWLDGGLEHGSEGRWSFVGAGPCEVKRVPFGDPSPLAALDGLVDERETLAGDGELPSPGQVPRWVGYLAYDAHWSGRPGGRHERDAGALSLWLARYEALYAFDHQREQGFVVGDGAEGTQALAEQLRALDGGDGSGLDFSVGPLEVPPEAAHREAVQRAVQHMRAGDIYQVNLARRFRGSFDGSALGLWMAMRAQSPVPLGAFVDAGDHAVLACTMERFLRFERDTGALMTRPIKGTLARSGDDDGAEGARLRSDPKEVAEHSMVVDLMRNDLGRVARAGSVRVDPLMEVEAFRGLHHLVSTVHAEARDGLTLGELLEATFPPGSVTGTPKLRAMEIIEALEPCARGIYCGAVGFVDRAGGCSWAVAIRTATVASGRVDYFAGGGLVVESDPERETRETVLKAGVFLRATGHES